MVLGERVLRELQWEVGCANSVARNEKTGPEGLVSDSLDMLSLDDVTKFN